MIRVWVFMVGYNLAVVDVRITTVSRAADNVERLRKGTPSRIVVAEEWSPYDGRRTGRKLTSPEADD